MMAASYPTNYFGLFVDRIFCLKFERNSPPCPPIQSSTKPLQDRETKNGLAQTHEAQYFFHSAPNHTLHEQCQC